MILSQVLQNERFHMLVVLAGVLSICTLPLCCRDFGLTCDGTDSTVENIEFMLRDRAYGMIYKQTKILQLMKATGVRTCVPACQLVSISSCAGS